MPPGKVKIQVIAKGYQTFGDVYEVDESAFHHSASEKAGGNASGILQLKDVTVANGVVSGEVYTKPGADLFDAKIEIDVKFKVPMPK